MTVVPEPTQEYTIETYPEVPSTIVSPGSGSVVEVQHGGSYVEVETVAQPDLLEVHLGIPGDEGPQGDPGPQGQAGDVSFNTTVLPVVKRNYIQDPLFEVLTGSGVLANWGHFTVDATATRDTSVLYEGRPSIRFDNGTGNGWGRILNVKAGTTYTISAYFKVASNATFVEGVDRFRLYTAQTVSAAYDLIKKPGEWQHVFHTFTATADAASISAYFANISTTVGTYWVANPQVEEGFRATPYIDGTMPGCRWSGEANTSPSEMLLVRGADIDVAPSVKFIPNTHDLDHYTDPGVYIRNSSSGATMARHYPFEGWFGYLEVIVGHELGDMHGLMQRATSGSSSAPGPKVYVRTFRRLTTNSTQWSPWIRVDSGLEGVGSPHNVLSAPVGTFYTDIAGTAGAWRWLKVSGTGVSGWKVIYGDTGRRDISSLLDPAWKVNPTSGRAWYRRQNDTVHVDFRLVAAQSITATARHQICTLGTDLRPQSYGTWGPVLVGSLSTQGQLSNISSATRLDAILPTAVATVADTTYMMGSATWVHDASAPWLTTLPGVASA